eukprot:CAMPEP_0201230468 /NCGR_PEP_ID=MMETSP0852-20130820/1851_1 /ASSEMBLY_ACC=CAM_ASM_000632 /TAXON_ID=183588 /ORGANISM="Pseudo-nitzschia fraudulenta, Strain WWA7" /LENGTH=177 /DNA_ID=CAMNT_0047521275 /DNA_START=765 /DNA_END=1298 /DNA_ORIENTATION=-
MLLRRTGASHRATLCVATFLAKHARGDGFGNNAGTGVAIADHTGVVVFVFVTGEIVLDPFDELPGHELVHREPRSSVVFVSFAAFRFVVVDRRAPVSLGCRRRSRLSSGGLRACCVGVAPGLVAAAAAARVASNEVAHHLLNIGLGPDDREIDPSLDAKNERDRTYHHTVIHPRHLR